jgi:DNA-binding CsgD family transcriptional regulator
MAACWKVSRLSHGEYARLLAFVADIQESAISSDFGAELIKTVARHFEGVMVAFDQIHPASGTYLINHDSPVGENEVPVYFARLQEVYTQNPIYQYNQKGGKEAVVESSGLMSRRNFHRTDFYQDIFKPLGLEHQIVVTMPREGWISSLTVNRDKAFAPETIEILRLAARHIIGAHRIACELADLRRELADEPPALLHLTLRETEVFRWMKEGKRNGEIAVILGCSPRTIEKHVENILRKSGSENRMAAVRTR